MTYYDDIYDKRLNRFGRTLQQRIQGQREREFANYVKKSVYQVGFTYKGIPCMGTLEPYKQDEIQVIAYLLTDVHLDMPEGTVLTLPDKNHHKQKWMIWWLESMKASGYNRYVTIKIDEIFPGLWGYIEGPHERKMRDTVRSLRGDSYYTEDENLYLFITPANLSIKKDLYLETAFNGYKQSFVVAGIDATVPGLMYVSLEPVYTRDNSSAPEQGPTDDPDDFYWLNGGGESNGSP